VLAHSGSSHQPARGFTARLTTHLGAAHRAPVRDDQSSPRKIQAPSAGLAAASAFFQPGAAGAEAAQCSARGLLGSAPGEARPALTSRFSYGFASGEPVPSTPTDPSAFSFQQDSHPGKQITMSSANQVVENWNTIYSQLNACISTGGSVCPTLGLVLGGNAITLFSSPTSTVTGQVPWVGCMQKAVQSGVY